MRSTGTGFRQLRTLSGNQPVASLTGIAINAFGMIARSRAVGGEDTVKD